MDLFSYIVAHDSGFAPNPFYGFCTLACCKPVIRRKAEVGDIIVGLSSKDQGNRIIYIMKVTDRLSFEEYWRDERFGKKKPACRNKPVCTRTPAHRNEPDGPEDEGLVGDNIYEPLDPGGFIQHCSGHAQDDMNKDLGQEEREGTPDEPFRNVLVSNHFVYFGAQSVALPPPFNQRRKARRDRKPGDAGLIVLRQIAHLSLDEGAVIAQFDDYFEALLKVGKKGCLGKPSRWPPHAQQSEPLCRTSGCTVYRQAMSRH